MPENGTDMSAVEITADALAQRVALGLRAVYPKNTTKHVMRDLRANLDTARSWVEGRRAPQAHRLLEMGRRYGPKFMARLDEDALWARQLASADSRIEALKARRAALEADLAALTKELGET